MKKIISYNINGIRAAIRKDFTFWLKKSNPDIVCLQEIKANAGQFNVFPFLELGYECFWYPAKKAGYSGVALLSKQKPKHIEYGCGIKDIDDEGRIIRADYRGFSVMSVYFPSGSSGDLRQAFKINFLGRFQDYINELRKIYSNLIISGDFNICHQAIDIHNPVRNKNTSGFLPEEREWLNRFFRSGFIDAFRYFNSEPHQYSWWSYRANARVKNLGWRIDYNMITNSLEQKLKRATILAQAHHSDHCPVLVELDI
tara:strand:- start:257 stop:1024 length:768 start_codon:yes stop_codon:yes gene_type:complete